MSERLSLFSGKVFIFLETETGYGLAMNFDGGTDEQTNEQIVEDDNIWTLDKIGILINLLNYF